MHMDEEAGVGGGDAGHQHHEQPQQLPPIPMSSIAPTGEEEGESSGGLAALTAAWEGAALAPGGEYSEDDE
jgi:hypothetical protein